jgi:carbamoyltransferase
MKIFSFSSGAHDSSYAIYHDNKIISHDELERHTRIKECDGDILEFYSKIGSLDDFDIITTFPHGNNKWYPNRFGDINKNKFIEVGHHQSHAANAFFSSKFNESLIITVDGGGWDRTKHGLIASTITVWEGNDTKIKNILYSNEYNLGMAWQNVTKNVFGMSGGGPPYGCQAGTVMAMAAMGNKNSFNELDINVFKTGFDFSKYSNLNEIDKFNFAAKFQDLTEIFMKDLISQFIGENKYLCLSGGTILNSVMTGKVWDWFPQLENIYIPPVPYDAGLAIGNIQYIVHHINNVPRKKYIDNITPYLGKTYSKEDVMSAINERQGIKWTIVKDDDVVDLLIDKNIVSVFNNGSESGRRALGNRSILADPRYKDMKDIINEKVKHRQSFRPFAPSILRERVTDWFVKDIDSPYMQFVIPFKNEKTKEVPAVVHFDGTARLQTVTENDNKWYYNFIKKFENRTTVPILLNTSFNDREPIVETPEHAINCFLKTNIDYLYFSQFNILVEKNNE